MILIVVIGLYFFILFITGSPINLSIEHQRNVPESQEIDNLEKAEFKIFSRSVEIQNMKLN